MGLIGALKELQPHFQKIATYLEEKSHVHIVFIWSDSELGVKAFFLGTVVEKYQGQLFSIMISWGGG